MLNTNTHYINNLFNKHAEKEFKLLRDMQKKDPNAAKFLFSNISFAYLVCQVKNLKALNMITH